MKALQDTPAAVKPYKVSHSKLQTFRRCLQQFHWKYIDKYFPPPGIGQLRGTAGHAALATWHREYQEQAAMDEAWKIWEAHGHEADTEWALLEKALNRYFGWSRTVSQDKFYVVESEQEFDITYAADHTVQPIILNGFIDGLVEEGGRTWLLENKFYKRMDNNPLDLDIQVSIYMLAATILQYPVQGVIYNIIRIGDTKVAEVEPAVRRRVYRNTQGLSYIQEEILQQVKAMQKYEQEGGVPYRNPTKDCHWDCAFYQACLSINDDGQYPKQILTKLSNPRSKDYGEQIAEEW